MSFRFMKDIVVSLTISLRLPTAALQSAVLAIRVKHRVHLELEAITAWSDWPDLISQTPTTPIRQDKHFGTTGAVPRRRWRCRKRPIESTILGQSSSLLGSSSSTALAARRRAYLRWNISQLPCSHFRRHWPICARRYLQRAQ